MTLDEFVYEPLDMNRITAVGYSPTQADVAKAVVLVFRTAEYVHDLAEELRTISKHDNERIAHFEAALERTGLIDLKGRIIQGQPTTITPALPASAHVPQFAQPEIIPPAPVKLCTCVKAVKIKDGTQDCILCGGNAYHAQFAFSHTPEGQALHAAAAGLVDRTIEAQPQEPTNLLPFPGANDDDEGEADCEIETEPPPYEHELIEAVMGAENLPLNMVAPQPCTCEISPLVGGDDHGVLGEYCPVCGGV